MLASRRVMSLKNKKLQNGTWSFFKFYVYPKDLHPPVWTSHVIGVMFPCWAEAKQINLQINNTEAVCTCLNAEKSENIHSQKLRANSKLTPETRPHPKRKGESIPTIQDFRCKLLGSGRINFGGFCWWEKNPNSANSSDTFFSLKLIGFKHLTIR